MRYIPDTLLLNHVYVPFFSNPIKKIYTCDKDFVQLESGPNGVVSIIPLVKTVDGNEEPVVPFIDLTRYDVETKDWFWYDSDNFPFRISYNNGYDWNLNSIWNFGQYYGHTLTFNPKRLYNGGLESGFYSEVTKYDGEESADIRVYTGAPIILTINENIVTDKTNYDGTIINPVLTQMNVEINKEFYYDINTNKIYTNQNLAGINPSQIKIYFETIPNSISVKCRMKGNMGEDLYTTPTIDYYVVKLNGQYLKG